MLYIEPILGPLQIRMTGDLRAEQREQVALQQLDQLFAYMLLSEMRKAVGTGGLFGVDKTAQRIYDDLFNDVMASAMAQSGQLGVAQ